MCMHAPASQARPCSLQAQQDQKVMVYMLTCACVDYYADVLAQLKPAQLEGVRLTALHGKMKQAAREKALAQFASEPAGGSALLAGSCSGCHAEWLSLLSSAYKLTLLVRSRSRALLLARDASQAKLRQDPHSLRAHGVKHFDSEPLITAARRPRHPSDWPTHVEPPTG